MKGEITLLGAGPGDVELLTVKGRRKLAEADVIIYDRLVNRELLSYSKEDCEFIYVGKEPQYHPVPQTEIENLLIEKAQAGKKVVRLKGGDPYVFGRGGEEGKALREHDIPFEIVPGITSAIGGLAYGGIPITYRQKAGAFHVITAHRCASGLALDWPILARLTGTLVFLMGVSELATICRGLWENGMAKETPAAVIHWATRNKQQVVVGTLSSIEEKVMEARLASPSLIVVGETIQMRDYLNVFETRPLFGQQLLIPNHATQLRSLLIDRGAAIVSFHEGQLVETDWQVPTILPKELIFTHRNSWLSFLSKWLETGKDIRELQPTISGIGHHTCQEIEKSGIQLTRKANCLQEIPTGDALIFGVGQVNHQIVTHYLVYSHPYKGELKDVTGICLPHSKAATDLLAQYKLSELVDKPLYVMGKQTAKALEEVNLVPIVSPEASFHSLMATIEHYQEENK